MHMYAKCDKNIPCVSRVMNILIRDGGMDSHSGYSAYPEVVQYYSLDMTQIPSKQLKAGHHQSVSKTPFELHFPGGPIVVRHCVLAGYAVLLKITLCILN